MNLRGLYFLIFVVSSLFCAPSVNALVLPEDRADVLYHSYDGGGVEVSGPSVLLRKKFSENLSASYNNYVDTVSSASIDVVTSGASRYSEERQENSLNLDYLHEKTLINGSFTNSSESDYEADTFSLSISQDMFGDLTTVSMGYSQGDNTIRSNVDDSVSENADSRSYRVSLTQVMTQDLIMSFSFEAITDEGFLGSVYRSVRYINEAVALGYSFQREKYPNTHTSNAFAINGRYYLAPRSVLHAGYRLYSDDWGVEASNYELGYTFPLPYDEDWLLELGYRYYAQTHADFYSDLLPFGGGAEPQTFYARDKELSTYNDQAISLGASYEFNKNGSGFIKKGTANLFVDYISFQYDDFRDLTETAVPGEEPLYEMNATVLRLFVSIWF